MTKAVQVIVVLGTVAEHVTSGAGSHAICADDEVVGGGLHVVGECDFYFSFHPFFDTGNGFVEHVFDSILIFGGFIQYLGHVTSQDLVF
jgi:hypothetical protein